VICVDIGFGTDSVGITTGFGFRMLLAAVSTGLDIV
jgi:hypothetical protein